MSKKRRSLIEEVEEMAKEAPSKPTEGGYGEYHIVNPCKWLAVRNEAGEVIGSITKGSHVIGEIKGDKFYFEYEGQIACIDKKRVEQLQ